MSEPFSRTLQTANDADGIATLIERAAERAKKAGVWTDGHRLFELAQRYRDYAQALRETVEGGAPEVEDGVQEALL